MSETAQQIVVTLIAVGAVAWLVIQRRRKKTASGCASCAFAEAARSVPIAPTDRSVPGDSSATDLPKNTPSAR